MISSMVMGKKIGQMETNILEITFRVKDKEMECFHGKTELSMMSSIRIQFMEKELIAGLMEGNIQAIGKMTKCMEKGNLYLQMEENTLENMLKVKSMGMVVFNGQMEGVIMENGRMGNNKGKENILTRRE